MDFSVNTRRVSFPRYSEIDPKKEKKAGVIETMSQRFTRQFGYGHTRTAAASSDRSTDSFTGEGGELSITGVTLLANK